MTATQRNQNTVLFSSQNDYTDLGVFPTASMVLWPEPVFRAMKMIDAVVTLRAVNFVSSVSLSLFLLSILCPAYNWTQNWKHCVQMNWISVLVFNYLDYWTYIKKSNSNMNWLIYLFKLNARNYDIKRLMKNLDKCWYCCYLLNGFICIWRTFQLLRWTVENVLV